MGMRHGMLLASALLLHSAHTARAGTADECLALGFTDTLACSQCAKMGEFVKDEALMADCRGCCTDDGDEDATYASAVLEVCS